MTTVQSERATSLKRKWKRAFQPAARSARKRSGSVSKSSATLVGTGILIASGGRPSGERDGVAPRHRSAPAGGKYAGSVTSYAGTGPSDRRRGRSPRRAVPPALGRRSGRAPGRRRGEEGRAP